MAAVRRDSFVWAFLLVDAGTVAGRAGRRVSSIASNGVKRREIPGDVPSRPTAATCKVPAGCRSCKCISQRSLHEFVGIPRHAAVQAGCPRSTHDRAGWRKCQGNGTCLWATAAGADRRLAAPLEGERSLLRNHYVTVRAVSRCRGDGQGGLREVLPHRPTGLRTYPDKMRPLRRALRGSSISNSA